jgi:hypothetical protein
MPPPLSRARGTRPEQPSSSAGIALEREPRERFDRCASNRAERRITHHAAKVFGGELAITEFDLDPPQEDSREALAPRVLELLGDRERPAQRVLTLGSSCPHVG